MTLDPEEATRLCIEALRHEGAMGDAGPGPGDCPENQNLADNFESGDLRIVSAARLAALSKIAKEEVED